MGFTLAVSLLAHMAVIKPAPHRAKGRGSLGAPLWRIKTCGWNTPRSGRMRAPNPRPGRGSGEAGKKKARLSSGWEILKLRRGSVPPGLAGLLRLALDELADDGHALALAV